MENIKLKSTNIEEVKKLVDNIQAPIEEGVKDLVIGLRRWGIDTFGSCQGHFNNPICHFPKIDIHYKDLEKASRILWAWNDPKNKNKWVLRPSGVDWIDIIPSRTNRFRLYRNIREAKKFGKALQSIPHDYFDTVGKNKGIFIRENYPELA